MLTLRMFAASLAIGCTDAPVRSPAPDAPFGRRVEVVLDRGHFDEGTWVSEPVGEDRLLEPALALEGGSGSLARGWAVLSPGDAVARIARAGCGESHIPYRVGAEDIVLLPYPSCAAPDAPSAGSWKLDRHEVRWSDIARVRALGLFTDVPLPGEGEDDGPARYITLAEAQAWCAWQGAFLPDVATWRTAVAGSSGIAIADSTRDRLGSGPVGRSARVLAGLPPRVGGLGHEDLEGNVEEWLGDGTVIGGSFVSRPDAFATPRKVPPTARSETIGLRCVRSADP